MDLIGHLRQSAESLYPPVNGRYDRRHAEYLAGFAPGQEPRPAMCLLRTAGMERAAVLRAAEYVLRAARFDTGAGADYERGILDATVERTFEAEEGWLAWVPRENAGVVRVMVRAHLEVDPDGESRLHLSMPLPSWVEEFGGLVRAVLAEKRQDLSKEPHDVLLGPGERLGGPYTGMLWDYSGCATETAVADLREGDLPLGRWAFGWAGHGVLYGPELFLSRFRTGARMLYNGALICAPQNSGKTKMILRWALAANRAGLSVLLVDVKGNLRRELAGRLQGRVYHFSTDPQENDSDGINFLAGLEESTAVNRVRVRQLVEALMPKDGWDAGEQAYYYQNHVNWMTGLIQLVLLYRHYYPDHFVEREADLSVVYDAAAREEALYRIIDYIELRERQTEPQSRVEPGSAYWANEVSLLVDPARGGQRTGQYSYRTLTQSITNALRCFSRYGTLFSKTSRGRVTEPKTQSGRRFFRLEELNGEEGPVTIILAAREQDVDDAATIVSVTVKRLEHTLFERMQDSERGRDILLLLDETRRIKGFKPEEYITFARQARAGCVLAYQSLDQIGDDKKIRVILENVGTQVYLGSLVGETARHFIRMLPMRRQPTYSWSTTESDGRASEAVQTGFQMVEYLSAAELYRLPAGGWPALVYINSQPRREPILVDVEERDGTS